MNRPALFPILLALAVAIPACSFKPRVSDCVGRYFDYDRFRSELRYPINAYRNAIQGDVTIAVGVDARGRITHVDALNGDPLLVAGVRSALLWGSSPTQIDSTLPNPFAGYQRLTIRFLATGSTPKPRSDREIIVRLERGGQSRETNLPSAHAWDTVAKQPLLDTAQLRLSVRYPEQALRFRVGGATYITAYFGPDGTVGDAFAEMSDHPLFSDAAITAVRATKFAPAVGLDGKPKGVWLTIPIFFWPN